MKKLLLSLVMTACVLSLNAKDLKISVTQRKADCRYQVAENVFFDIILKDANGNPVSGKTIFYRITGDGNLKKNGKFVSADKPVTVTASLTKPGFIRLEVFRTGVTGSKVDSGAAFEPEKIRPATPCPADFNEFWAKERAAAAELTAKAKIEKISVIDKYPAFAQKCNLYDIRIDDGVLPTRGVLAIPRNATPKRHAIIMMFNGASRIGCGSAQTLLNQAEQYKAIVFVMNLHDTTNFPTKAESRQLRKHSRIDRYQYRDADDIGKYGAGDVFRRVLRAKAFLKSLPEWDGKTVIVRGGSLGGAQALFAAAGDPDVKLCIAGAPAMCDHLGWTAEQFSGWPDLFNDRLYRLGAKREAAIKVMPYFDIANFTPQVTCPVIMSVGYIDYICPPTSIWAAYNVLGSKDKVFHQVPLGTHGVNLDKSPNRVPGVFEYGGRETKHAALKAYQDSAE